MVRLFYDFLRDESGTTALEYALICTAIAMSLVTTLTNYGNKITVIMTKIGNTLM